MFSLFLIWSEWAIFFLRLILSIILITHGFQKLKNINSTAEWMNNAGFKPGKFWAIIVMFIEFFGGILLLLGFLNQIIALIVSVQFLIIVIWKIFKHQRLMGELELDILILASSLVIFFSGGGAASIDKFFGLF